MIESSALTLCRRRNWMVAGAMVVGTLANGADVARAALLVHEPFDYEAGVLLDQTAATGLNLTGVYSAADGSLPSQFQLVTRSPGLDYGSLSNVPTPAGIRLSQTSGTTAGGATVSVDEDVLVSPDQAIYFSALFTFDDSQNGTHRAHVALTNDENGDELAFGEMIGGVRNIRLTAATAATGELVAAGTDNAFTNGQTLLLLGRYFNSSAADGDVLELIGYDTADADTLPSSFDPADPNAELSYSLAGLDIDLTKITAISFTIRANDNNFIDELRIGSTYTSIVPEPSAALLLAASLGWALVLDRHRREFAFLVSLAQKVWSAPR